MEWGLVPLTNTLKYEPCLDMGARSSGRQILSQSLSFDTENI